MPGLAALDTALLRQRGHLLPWAPIFLSLGIGLFFSLRWEPGWITYTAFAAMGTLAAGLALWRPGGLAALGWAVAIFALGFLLAGHRSWSVAGPVLDFRYYGPIEGRIVGIDRSASDAVRLTLDQVVLEDMAVARHPDRVRVALHGPQDAAALTAGARVMTTGHLSPPQGAVEPGGFDFQRHAWFQGLGAVGYTRNPLLVAAPPAVDGLRMAILRLRMSATARMLEVLPGTEGGFAAAVTTGDRSGIDQEALDWLRAANTAHLLAISGLHMGLLVGFVFAVLRHGLALIPAVALRWDTRKLAAGVSLVAAAFYLAISGNNVATERAFIMASVMLVAVLLDRRAISLRSVAIAAMIVLALRPEALMGPGFQMSFAATVALVGVYGVMRDRRIELPGPRWTWPVSGVLLSSLVAGLATAPVGAMHFNAVAHYGLLANLLSVPMMGALVVPAAVVAAVLWPLGLEALGLWAMGLGLRWILWVAEWVAGLDGARSYLPSPEPWALPVLALGALVVLLWQGRARWIGVPAVLVALAGWLTPQRPEVLIADTGALVGVMTPEGRALSREKGAGFIATTWLENDGDAAAQDVAAARWSHSGSGSGSAAGSGSVRRMVLSDGREVIHVQGKRAAAAYTECGPGQIVVSAEPLDLTGPCMVLDARHLRRTGSLAITGDGLVTAREVSGARLWTGLSDGAPPAAGWTWTVAAASQ